MDCSPPGSSVNGISQTGVLEWVAVSFSRGSPALTGGIFFLNHWATWEAQKGNAVLYLVTQFCLTLCDPHGSPGSCVHRILQTRILEWVAMPSSRGSGDFPNPGIEPRFSALQVDYLPAELPQKPPYGNKFLQIFPSSDQTLEGMHSFLSSCSHLQVGLVKMFSGNLNKCILA